MTKNLAERCMNGIKGLEDQISESTTVEALNSYMNSNIFMWSKIPNNVDDLVLMETLMNYLNSSRDENIKRNVFNVLFLDQKEQRKIDFLVRLGSLVVTTLSTSALDVYAFWMKNSAPKPLFIILIKRLLTDILSVDPSRRDILQKLPEESITFTSIFLIGLTEAYQFSGTSNDKPCLTVLRNANDWVTNNKQLLFNPDSLQGNSDTDDNRNTPFPGLLFWTLSQPLQKINNDNISPQEDELIGKLHFELISYLDGRIRGSGSYLLSKNNVKVIIELIKKYSMPETPQSPGKEDVGINLEKNQYLNLSLIRLAEVIQIGMKNDAFQCSKSELGLLLKEISGHKYIDAVIQNLER